jgi:PAS domain S-box-containing protein
MSSRMNRALASLWSWASNPSTVGARRYVVAVVAIAASLLLRQLLQPWLGPHVPYLQFFPAILLAAWYGGFGPGALATAVATLASMYFYLPPDGLAINGAADAISLALFIGTGLAIAGLNDGLRRAEQARRVEAELATGRAERLDAIINTTVDGIIVINARGIVEEFNRGAERLFEYSASEIIGRNVSVLMLSPEHEEHDSYLQRYLATGHAKIIGTGREVTGRRRDGTTFPLHLSVGEMRTGAERKFTGMLHDLTKRSQLDERLRASEARWRAVIDSAVDGIIVIDLHGRIESFNPAAERLFGHSERDVIGRNVDLIIPSPYREGHETYPSRGLATGWATIIGFGREVMGLRRDGTTFPLHLSVGQIMVGGERKFTGILHDLSARVQMEELIREQMSLAKLGEMSAVIAHEVKNPLAGIRGAIQVFASRMPKESADSSILTEIVNRIDSLDRMMKDLLLFARPPKPNREPTHLVQLVTATADFLRQDPLLQHIEVEITGSAPPISADADMLKIVFQNLLINGAHAMQGRGRIRVDVNAIDTTCEIAVSDAGPGIPLEVRQKIFTPFFTTKSRGSGLGLPTAKRLVDAHNGQIVIDCPPSGGTVVVVRLPMHS